MANFSQVSRMLVFCTERFSAVIELKINPRRPKEGGLSNPLVFFWITFLRVKQNQQDFTYSYLDKQKIAKRSKILQIRPGNKRRERCKLEGKVGE